MNADERGLVNLGIVTNSVANGLNQLASIGGSATTHDARGNLTFDLTTGNTFTYGSDNRLRVAYGGVPWTVVGHDALKRLEGIQVGTAITSFAYDGLEMIAEYDAAGALLRRHVHGPGVDEPLVTYEGSGTSNRRFLHADERGSIVALSDSAGAMLAINTYDEFGKPSAGNVGRFQYTGQAWLAEVGLHYYKARMYDSRLGRFLQTDPIGYEDNANLYAYVLNDPINFIDPLGLQAEADPIVVIGNRPEYYLLDPTRPEVPMLSRVGPTSGGAVSAGRAVVPEPCAKQATRAAAGAPYNVDKQNALEKSAEKYRQHLSPTNSKGQPQSVFGGDLKGPVHLYKLIGEAIQGSTAVPAGRGAVRITTATGMIVGLNARNNYLPTQYLTIILEPIGTTTNGLKDMKVVSVFPGCPKK